MSPILGAEDIRRNKRQLPLKKTWRQSLQIAKTPNSTLFVFFCLFIYFLTKLLESEPAVLRKLDRTEKLMNQPDIQTSKKSVKSVKNWENQKNWLFASVGWFRRRRRLQRVISHRGIAIYNRCQGSQKWRRRRHWKEEELRSRSRGWYLVAVEKWKTDPLLGGRRTKSLWGVGRGKVLVEWIERPWLNSEALMSWGLELKCHFTYGRVRTGWSELFFTMHLNLFHLLDLLAVFHFWVNYFM